jgi:hypothetical protein
VSPGDVPAWILIVTGAAAQGLIELLAADHVIYRLSAVLLLVAVLAANATPARDQRGQAITAGLLLAGATPLWFGHASGLLSDYGESSAALAALNPCLLTVGTAFRYLLRPT